MQPTTRLSRADLSDLLRSRGYRVTPQRLGIYEALAESGEHLTPEGVRERVRVLHPAVSLNTVYEVLETLTSVGAIRRADTGAGPRRYDANVAPHHHLLCRACDLQIDIPCGDNGTACIKLESGPEGFVVDEARITLVGLCSACRSASEVAAT
jgi:Fur family transcriptional regulator, peroxide stress response regulator